MNYGGFNTSKPEIELDFEKTPRRRWDRNCHFPQEIQLEAELRYSEKMRKHLNLQSKIDLDYDNLIMFNRCPLMIGLSKINFLKQLVLLDELSSKSDIITKGNSINLLSRFFRKFNKQTFLVQPIPESIKFIQEFIIVLFRKESWPMTSKWLELNYREFFTTFNDLILSSTIEPKLRLLLPDILVAISYLSHNLKSKRLPDHLNSDYGWLGEYFITIFNNIINLIYYNWNYKSDKLYDEHLIRHCVDSKYMEATVLYVEHFLIDYALEVANNNLLTSSIVQTILTAFLFKFNDLEHHFQSIQIRTFITVLELALNIPIDSLNDTELNDNQMKLCALVYDRMPNYQLLSVSKHHVLNELFNDLKHCVKYNLRYSMFKAATFSLEAPSNVM